MVFGKVVAPHLSDKKDGEEMNVTSLRWLLARKEHAKQFTGDL